MGPGTESDLEELDAEQYWRRRAAVLAGVLAVVGLLAWACGSGGEGEAVRGAAAAGAASTPIPPAVPSATPTKSAEAQREDGSCDPEAVVVTMTTVRRTYGPGERPRFQVIAVNTGDRACEFGVGPGDLDLRIRSGADKVWSSAACARGRGSSVRTLRKGIPYVEIVSWDRKRTTGDCPGARPSARPGTYVATIDSKIVKTPAQVFRLR
ncbi:hypothetical protein [Actinomadura sp. 9N407]|uniref:hypothetical protein n=1 Tax=Actinomadura sp. 9N407 TaxID=3375154 RepID=UPI0037939A36